MSSITIPKDHTFYSYYYDSNFLSWRRWETMVEEDEMPKNSSTAFCTDLIRISYLAGICFSQKANVAIHSNLEGSGKTTCLKHAFEVHGSKKGVKKAFLSVNTNSSVLEFCKCIETHLVQKRHKTIGLGHGESLIVMIDDLFNESISNNSAMFDAWRSYSEQSGWYTGDHYLHVENLTIGITLRTSDHYRLQEAQQRSLCHFVNLSIADNSKEKLQEINKFWTTDSHLDLIGPYYECFGEILVNITFELLSWMISTFPRMASCSHYSFTTREAIRVIKSNAEHSLSEKNTSRLLQVWVYDILRIFGDQLVEVNNDNIVALENKLSEILLLHVEMDIDEIIGNDERPLSTVSYPRELTPFSDKMKGEKPSAIVLKPFKNTLEFAKKQWSGGERSVISYDQIKEVGNTDGVCLSMKIHHQLKLAGRVLVAGENYFDRGLVTRMTCAATGNPFIEMISLNSELDPIHYWSAFLDQAVSLALESWKPVVIFVRMSDVVAEYQWRDLSDILQWGCFFGALRNLEGFSDSAKSNITKNGFEVDEPGILDEYIRYSRMIRLVLSFDSKETNPLFLKTLNKYPAIRSTPTVWVTKWSLETISSYSFNITRQSNTPWINEFLAYVSNMVEKLTTMEKSISGSSLTPTPTILKSALSVFSDLMSIKSKYLESRIAKFNVAISAAEKALAAINQLKTDFETVSNRLVENERDTQAYLKNLEYERENRDRIAVEIQILHEASKRCSLEVENLERQYALELARVAPAVELASEGINDLKKNDIYEIRSMINPPKGVILVLECILLIFRVDMRGSDGVWELSKRLMSESKFVQNITNFDKDSLTNPQMNRVSALTRHSEFLEDNLLSVSRAIYSLAKWVLSLKAYHDCNMAFEPKKRSIQEQKSKAKYYLSEVTRNEAKLEASESNLASMKSRFDTVIQAKEAVGKKHKDVESKFKSSSILG